MATLIETRELLRFSVGNGPLACGALDRSPWLPELVSAPRLQLPARFLSSEGLSHAAGQILPAHLPTPSAVRAAWAALRGDRPVCVLAGSSSDRKSTRRVPGCISRTCSQGGCWVRGQGRPTDALCRRTGGVSWVLTGPGNPFSSGGSGLRSRLPLCSSPRALYVYSGRPAVSQCRAGTCWVRVAQASASTGRRKFTILLPLSPPSPSPSRR